MAPDKKTESCRPQHESHELRVRKKNRPTGVKTERKGAARAVGAETGAVGSEEGCTGVEHAGAVGAIDVAVLLAGPLLPRRVRALAAAVVDICRVRSFP